MADDLRPVQCELEKLEEGDKAAKKQALENIASFVKSISDDLPENKRKILASIVIKPLLSVLSDATERCRELAAQLLLEFCTTLPVPDDTTSYIFPTLKKKLEDETCEEVRLLEAQTLTQTVSGGKCAKHLNDIILAVRTCLADPFSEVKKEGCRCVLQLEKAAQQHFHLQCESLVAPLIQLARHPHSTVRVLAVQALGGVVEQSGASTFGRILTTANTLLHDGSPAVRVALVVSASRWQLAVSTPILLVALSDPVCSVNNRAAELWADMGLRYAEDKALKQVGPREGCEALVQQQLAPLLSSALEALEEWRPEERERGARLLQGCLTHAGRHAQPHVATLLPVLAAVLASDEQRVCLPVEQSLAALGCAVCPEVWVEVLSGSPCSTGFLKALRALVGACPPQHLRPYADQLFPLLFQYAASDLKNQVLVVESLDTVLASVVDPMELSVKELLCTCLALASHAPCKVDLLLEHLSQVLGLPGVEELCVVYGKDIVQDLSDDRPPSRWDILRQLVLHTGDCRTDMIPSLLALLNASQRRPEWQAQAAAILELALALPDVPAQYVTPLLHTLRPLLDGKARLAALKCLHRLLTTTSTSPLQAGVEVSAAIVSLLEDKQAEVRAMACRVAPACLPPVAATRGLTRRLDDVAIEVRIAAAHALQTVATEEILPEIMNTLLLHAHDNNPAVRTACSAVLEKLTGSSPEAHGQEALDE